ncbi:MAG: TatD family hydrolase [Elusimicrobiales bacterium]
MICDSHAHLCNEAFSEDREDALSRARAAGVRLVVEIACGPGEWDAAAAFSERHGGFVFHALGFHPHECGSVSDESMARLERLLPGACALGEIGLDYARSQQPRARQLEVLERMLELGGRLGLPLVLHCRNGADASANAYADMLDMLEASPRAAGKVAGIAHCFSGSPQDARRLMDMGFLLGVNGTLTYPKNSELRGILGAAGPGRLVLETDCPYLPPQSRRGKRSEPADLPEICGALARIIGLTPEETARAAFDNCLAVFGLEGEGEGFRFAKPRA